MSILFQYPVLLLQILFIFKVGQNSTVSIVTYCGVDGLGFKCWCGQDFLNSPSPTQKPNQPPVQSVPVCFLLMKWPACGTDHHPPLQLFMLQIQRAIPLHPLCVCLAHNGTAFTFIHIQIPYKHITTIGQRPLKIYAVTPDCLT